MPPENGNGNGNGRKATAIQWVRDILTLIIVPILGWMLLAAVQTQKEIIQLQYQVATVAKEVMDHTIESKVRVVKNATLHHTSGVAPCERCHEHK